MDGAGARAKTSALTTSTLVASADAASLAKLHNSNNSEEDRAWELGADSHRHMSKFRNFKDFFFPRISFLVAVANMIFGNRRAEPRVT